MASGVYAVDGVREINQACAAGPGCFSGDTAGFPVQIGSPGSYRLTSGLSAPSQNTTLISVGAADVALDLNGFALRGTNSYSGPGGVCSGSGSGIGVLSSSSDVTVTNGHVLGMGSHGLSLLGAGSRVERVIVYQSCGNGIRVGSGSLVAQSVARQNSLNGIVADQNSRVSGSLAKSNGQSGISSTSVNSGYLAVDGCISSSNGADGIFVGQRSLVRGSLTASNLDDGIGALGSGQVVENVAVGNTDRGITVLGGAGTGDSTAVGFNVSNGNGGLELSGGTVIGCNVIEGASVCPP